MKYQRYGLTVERPNAADEGSPITDDEIRNWVRYLLEEFLFHPDISWTATQSGNSAVYVLLRNVEHVPRYHILIFQGREAFCADLTEEQAAEFLTT